MGRRACIFKEERKQKVTATQKNSVSETKNPWRDATGLTLSLNLF